MFEVAALLDAAGPFFEPREKAFPDASEADWAAAERLDPDAFGANGSWNLVFHCFAIRGPTGRVTLVDAGSARRAARRRAGRRCPAGCLERSRRPVSTVTRSTAWC